MNDTKHTPGPWKVEPRRVSAREGVQTIHRRPHSDQARTDEEYANCHLIAAAPDLLAALERLYIVADGAGWLRKDGDALSEAFVAIKAAKGEA